MPPHLPSKNDKSINPMEMAGLGMEIAAPIILGAWVATTWKLGSWPVLAGLALAITGAVAHVLIFLKRQKQAEHQHPKRHDS